MKTTAAITRESGGQFEIVDVELPDLQPDEVLVRIVGVGICHTDIVSRDGKLGARFPTIFGHEGSGVVQAIGSAASKVAPGDHVVLSPASDGTCKTCQRGAPMYCEQFNALNLQTDPAGRSAKLLTGGNARLKYFGQSSFAHHALASERNAIKIAKDVPLGILGPLGCGIQTGAGTVMNGMRPRPGSSIAILGTGAVGLAALLAARVCECETIIVVDRVESRLKLAQALGATHLINTVAAADLRKAMRDILPRGADYIVDCAGVPSLIGAALGGLGPLGTLGLVAVPPSLGLELSVPWFSLVNGGQRIQGFVEGNSVPEVYIPQLVELYRTGRFPFDKLIKTYPFERINEAVNDQETGQTIKAVLEVREN